VRKETFQVQSYFNDFHPAIIVKSQKGFVKIHSFNLVLFIRMLSYICMEWLLKMQERDQDHDDSPRQC